LDLESFDDEDRSSSTWFVRPPPHKKSRKEIDKEKKMKGIEILLQEFLKAKGGDISHRFVVGTSGCLLGPQHR
jgi:hypothetical protein